MTTTTTTYEPFLSPHTGKEEVLCGLIEPIVVAEGLELVVLQLARGQHKDTLRLSVDRPGAGVTPGKGVSMAELERLSRMLGDFLDVEDADKKLFRDLWDLEVGSPGVDRPLTKKSHFNDVMGAKLKARLKLEKKSIVGRLQEVDDTSFVIEGERYPFSDLDHAHVVFEFAEPKKPGKGPAAEKKPKGQKAPKAPKVESSPSG